MKPFPTDLPQTINPDGGPSRSTVEEHRNLNCHHYDPCLDEAVRQGWQSFTCIKCPLYALSAGPELGIDAYANQRRGF